MAQANLASKNDSSNFEKKADFDELQKLNKNKINSTKTIHILVENELNELLEKDKLSSTKDYSFVLVRIYFTGNEGFQNVCLSTNI